MLVQASPSAVGAPGTATPSGLVRVTDRRVPAATPTLIGVSGGTSTTAGAGVSVQATGDLGAAVQLVE